jgi:hypothetical protein
MWYVFGGAAALLVWTAVIFALGYSAGQRETEGRWSDAAARAEAERRWRVRDPNDEFYRDILREVR